MYLPIILSFLRKIMALMVAAALVAPSAFAEDDVGGGVGAGGASGNGQAAGSGEEFPFKDGYALADENATGGSWGGFFGGLADALGGLFGGGGEP